MASRLPRPTRPDAPYVYALEMNTRALDIPHSPGRIRRVIHVVVHLTQYDARDARRLGVGEYEGGSVQIGNKIVEPAAAADLLAIWRAGCQHTGTPCLETGNYFTTGIQPPWGVMDAAVAAADKPANARAG